MVMPRPSPILRSLLLVFTFAAAAQTDPTKPELLLYHPTSPLSYDVATIKPIDAATADRMVRLPPGMSFSPLSLRRYIMNAYGAIYEAQVIGGPDWLAKDGWDIKGKPSDEIEAAQQNMKNDDRQNQNRAMQQSLLADRFDLKAHFETRVLPVYELVPAKGGLRITAVAAPPERKAGDPPPPPPAPGGPLPPGVAMIMVNSNGLQTYNAKATKMQSLARFLGSSSSETDNRPIVDHTGFTGYFDVKDLEFAPLSSANAASAPDAPSLAVALQEKLGIRLVAAKDPIEVLVIDSIDRPTEN